MSGQVENQENWNEEMRSAYLYEVLAQKEKLPNRKQLFISLAAAARGQAKLWGKRIDKQGEPVPTTYLPDSRTRLVAWLIQVIGPERIKPVLAAMKVRGLSVYSGTLSSHDKPTAAPEQTHRAGAGGGNLRAIVFGVSDGLVSNASLILGVLGATSDSKQVVFSGVAGLFGGAFSMAVGEYISVRSQRELYEYQIHLEREELREYPQEEALELALIYEAKGIERKQAKQMADHIISDPAVALDTLAKEELGLNPAELGSPYAAAFFSFISFSVGALLPLLPSLFHWSAILRSTWILSATSLFCIGSFLSLFTGRGFLLGGLRLLVLGGGAGIITHLIGTTFSKW